MLVRDVIGLIDKLAPFELAEPWDHVGLQVGARDDEVRAVLVSLEADDEALAEAKRLECGLVLSHHPLIFEPLAGVTDASPAARTALAAARGGVAVIAAHTNLDKARGGIADQCAQLLGLEATVPLAPAAADWLKLAGFVPADDVGLVRTALFAAGAGVIGGYEHCSWSVAGQGTFFGTEGTEPMLGRAGRDETVDEVRLEAVFPRRLRRRVVDAFVSAHPYEEPAFDVYAVEDEIASVGLGRLGELPAPQTLAAFAADVAAALRLPAVRFAGDPARRVRRIACLPGSGAEAIARGVAAVADVLVTGDVKYHEARAALAAGLALVDAPHEVVEEVALLRWSETLADALGPYGVRVETYAAPGPVWQVTASVNGAAHEAAGVTDEAGARAEATSAGRAAKPATPATVPDNRDDARYHLYTDGGARGNPGPAGIGARLLTASGDLVDELSDAIGEATNNVAEYQALISGLELALDRGVQRLDVFMDSELVVRQVNGQYKVKEPTLKALHAEATRLVRQFREIAVQHVRREQNAEADRLVNEAIDAALG